MSLCLTTIPAVELAGAEARVFANPADACRHLRDHVLVEPECFAWADILPGWGDLLGDREAATERHNERTRLGHTNGESAQELYDEFAAAIREDAADASFLKWVAVWNPPAGSAPEVKPTAVCLGTRAVVMVFEWNLEAWVLKTAFIPEQGDPRETVRSRQEHRPRVNQTLRRDQGHRRDLVRRAAVEADWSADERFYYRVFRPAVKFLRNHHSLMKTPNGRPIDRHYGLLYDRLPATLIDDPKVWIAFRRACGRSSIGI